MLLHAEPQTAFERPLEVNYEDQFAAAMALDPADVVKRFDASLNIGILGPRGATKSGLAAMLAGEYMKDVLKITKGKTSFNIFHNGFLNFGIPITIDDVMEYHKRPWLRDGWIIIDEVQEWFDPKRSNSLVQYKLSHMMMQPRKLNISVMWTTQKERRVSPDLKDQTDFAIYATATQRPWRPARGTKPKYFTPDYAPRCTERNHEKCTKYPKQHTVGIRIVSQDNLQLASGLEERAVMHCVQRFYPLWNSDFVVNNDEVLTLNADKLRQRERFNTEMTAGMVVLELVNEGRMDKIGGAQFAVELALRTGGDIQVDSGQAGKMLSHWLGGAKRTGRERYYVVKETDQLAALAQSQAESDSE